MMTVAGQTPISYSHDDSNRLTQITSASSSTTMTYDDANRRATLTLSNGVTTSYGYDDASQITSLLYHVGATPLGNLTYTYDAAGRRTRVDGSFARSGLPNPVSSAVYDAANALTSWGGLPLIHDRSGNVISDGVISYNWDARNQLMSAGSGAYQYDVFGRRVQNQSGTQFLYDGTNSVQELPGTTVIAHRITGEVDEFFSRTDTNGSYYPLLDPLNSVIALVDSNGNIATQYTYEPFGNTSISGVASSNTAQYTGRENDPNGLYYYRARYYSPQFGRFMSEDPVGFLGGLNLYSYVNDDPISHADPEGLCPFCFFIEDTAVPISPELLQQATNLAKPRNSLPLPDGGRLDIAGDSHWNKPSGPRIPTPHVHDPLPPYEGVNAWRPRPPNPKIAREATPEDFIKAIEHNRPKAVPVPLSPRRLGGRKDEADPDSDWTNCYRSGLCS